MRFSSAFQPSSDPQPAHDAASVHVAEVAAEDATIAPRHDGLPDDLDARVRLIGEWQLGEAC